MRKVVTFMNQYQVDPLTKITKVTFGFEISILIFLYFNVATKKFGYFNFNSAMVL
jgi:hypothetical protein